MADRMERDRGWRARDGGVGQPESTVCYPKENTKLYEKVLERGAIVSESPIVSHPAPENFPVRNRIIAGMADHAAAGRGVWRRGIPGAGKRNAGCKLCAEPAH
jgi:hypothetical protein